MAGWLDGWLVKLVGCCDDEDGDGRIGRWHELVGCW